MGFYSCLEEIERCGAIGIGLHLFTLGIHYGGHLIHEGNHVAEELHQTTNTHVLTCTYTEYGEYATAYHTLADTFAHLILGERLGLEELLHQSLIVLGSSLHECLVPLLGLLHL